MAMKITVGLPVLLFSTVLVGAAAPPATHRSATAGTLSSIALSKPFGARPGWRFAALQGAEIRDPFDAAGGEVPGVIRLCISPGDGRRCRPSLDRLLTHGGAEDLFSHAHFLDDARIVYPRSHLPLLFIQAASLHSGDGDQRVATTALIYDDATDAFIPVYEKQTGKNNDQEIRYVKTGAVRGVIISSEPTADAPFGFWITVNRIGSGKRYRC